MQQQRGPGVPVDIFTVGVEFFDRHQQIEVAVIVVADRLFAERLAPAELQSRPTLLLRPLFQDGNQIGVLPFAVFATELNQIAGVDIAPAVRPVADEAGQEVRAVVEKRPLGSLIILVGVGGVHRLLPPGFGIGMIQIGALIFALVHFKDKAVGVFLLPDFPRKLRAVVRFRRWTQLFERQISRRMGLCAGNFREEPRAVHLVPARRLPDRFKFVAADRDRLFPGEVDRERETVKVPVRSLLRIGGKSEPDRFSGRLFRGELQRNRRLSAPIRRNLRRMQRRIHRMAVPAHPSGLRAGAGRQLPHRFRLDPLTRIVAEPAFRGPHLSLRHGVEQLHRSGQPCAGRGEIQHLGRSELPLPRIKLFAHPALPVFRQL